MRKSSHPKPHYRPGTSRGHRSLATFREQMTDFARGDRLLELRAERRMSREEAAHAIGVTTKSLYTWEKKSGAIKSAHAKQVAEFYGVEDWQTLVTRDPEATGPSSRGQVLEGFQEFRGHVAGLEDRLDRIEAELKRRVQHDKHVAGLIDNQNELLRDQAAVLATIKTLLDMDDGVSLRDRLSQMVREAQAQAASQRAKRS